MIQHRCHVEILGIQFSATKERDYFI